MTPLTPLIPSDQLCQEIAAESDTVILSFSCGKDSIAAWLQLRRYFKRIEPVYLYLVPDLEFIERSLAYYESWFNCKIMRVPHPSFFRMMDNFVFQAPENLSVIDDLDPPVPDYEYTFARVKETLGLPDETMTALGVRAVDSPMRMTAIRKYGAVNWNKSTFYPVYDWNKERLVNEIKGAGVRLPVDYRLWGRSFDGLDYRFTKGLRDTFPNDYKRILEFFPLAEVEILRMQYREAHYAQPKQ